LRAMALLDVRLDVRATSSHLTLDLDTTTTTTHMFQGHIDIVHLPPSNTSRPPQYTSRDLPVTSKGYWGDDSPFFFGKGAARQSWSRIQGGQLFPYEHQRRVRLFLHSGGGLSIHLVDQRAGEWSCCNKQCLDSPLRYEGVKVP
jgi:hypothetical protein